jgi:hypothetical protein
MIIISRGILDRGMYTVDGVEKCSVVSGEVAKWLRSLLAAGWWRYRNLYIHPLNEDTANTKQHVVLIEIYLNGCKST